MPTALRPAIIGAYAAILLAGCALSTATVTSPLAGLSCVDDTPDCIKKRQATLSYMTNDPTRAWVRQTPSAHAYASGVRLFAFKKKKSELTCDELKIGSNEAANASKILRGPDAESLTPAQVSRGTLLAAEVSRELRRELSGRCKDKA
ncbi:MAG: hypothetical protein APF80_15660 [Alphaproteobacteria bacterium BRH_c36]|nr:MAG: hypothetical protein APF80_15660 [Alphaproteobacteria bacterium BRH_c36]